MMPDPDRCYRVLRSRDPRFDGAFFVGVVTTGVYCRAVCPAMTPRRENARFYPCAAAAEQAGFRPCRRCRPEWAPGTPRPADPDATLRRALNGIANGVVDRGGIEELARLLGLGSRHLRRLFAGRLGASPLQVAQSRRIQLARRLIDETALTMGEVAMAAGFGSVRRFNHAVRRVFGGAPSVLRERRRKAAEPDASTPGAAGIVLRLPFRPPLPWADVLGYLAARAIPGVEAVVNGRYRRNVVLDGAAGTIEIGRPAGASHLLLRADLASIGVIGTAVERARRVFDLDADPLAVAEQLGADPLLGARLRGRPGMRIVGAWDGFEVAVRAILGQQVSVRAAVTLAGRLASRFGDALPDPGGSGLGRLFPLPSALAEADVGAIGLPRARAEAVRGLARAVLDGRLDLRPTADPAATRAVLESLPGIGPWTAAYVTLRALGDPDAFPAGDLGLQRAAGLAGAAALAACAERWRPWRGYAAFYLWTQTPQESPGRSRPARPGRRREKEESEHVAGLE